MLVYIDKFLNKYTMYKVVLYALFILVAYSMAIDFAWNKVVSLLILVVGSYILNAIIAKILRAPYGSESSTITGLILYLIVAPYASISTLCWIVVFAIVSKYIFAWKKRHIFNPAGFAVALGTLSGMPDFTWWIAGTAYLPVVLITGLLVVRKVRRFTMFATFIVISAAFALVKGIGIGEFFVSWPVIFFAAFMLTEPATTPPTKKLQISYALLVGVLFNYYFEYALVLANIYSFFVSSRDYIILRLKNRFQLANGVVEYALKEMKSFISNPVSTLNGLYHTMLILGVIVGTLLSLALPLKKI